MVAERSILGEKRRLLRLETLYDLALTLDAQRTEQELADEILERTCAVLDPAAAVAVTRDPAAGPRVASTVGWAGDPPGAPELLAEPLWREMLVQGESLARRSGELAGREFEELLATPISNRGVFLGYVAVLDKESRGGSADGFNEEDRRFLESVAALVGVAIDASRQVEDLRVERERLAEENKVLKGGPADQVGGQRIIAQSRPMLEVLEFVERVAPRGVSLLIRGESGTGKELIAKLVHLRSARPGPLIALNCAALPESLLESELFGIEGGVATGVEARRGKFELADGGTLFLDEIGDMPVAAQIKLLRALQEREVVRVGAAQGVPVDVRLVAATHRNVEELVAGGEFREDLYYRLKGVEVELPPLRQRTADIPHLVRYFADRFAQTEGIPVPRFAPEALALLMSHQFPGNVRELQNLVEAAVSLADDQVDGALVRSLLRSDTAESGPEALDLETVERRHVARVLQLVGGNKSRAARLLGIDRRTLQRKGF